MEVAAEGCWRQAPATVKGHPRAPEYPPAGALARAIAKSRSDRKAVASARPQIRRSARRVSHSIGAGGARLRAAIGRAVSGHHFVFDVVLTHQQRGAPSVAPLQSLPELLHVRVKAKHGIRHEVADGAVEAALSFGRAVLVELERLQLQAGRQDNGRESLWG